MQSKTQLTQTETQPPARRLIPVGDWPKFHPWPPIGGLRHIIFHSKTNGFGPAIKRVGRNVLIDEPVFFQIVDEKNREGA